MRRMIIKLLVGLSIMAFATGVRATDYFVDGSVASSGSGTSWAEAFKTIQEGVDASADGDTVVVSNGIYATGGIAWPTYNHTNRVCITNAISVRSVNGPETTIIQGTADNGGCGDAAVRGVYMTNSCALIGFTVTDGYTLDTEFQTRLKDSGGGIWMTSGCLVSNCVVSGNGADRDGGGICMDGGGLVVASTISANNAKQYGAGIYLAGDSTVQDCIVAGNSSLAGGLDGGGVYLDGAGTIFNSIVRDNAAEIGGGVAMYDGGKLANNLLHDNTASSKGGGLYVDAWSADDCPVDNCTITRNHATGDGLGGGVYLNWGGNLNNCIVWTNQADDAAEDGGADIYSDGGAVRYTCASRDDSGSGANPQWTPGEGCAVNRNPLFNAPQDDDFRLRYDSICLDAGANNYAPLGLSSNDLAGNPRMLGGWVDMGAYEYARPIFGGQYATNVETHTMQIVGEIVETNLSAVGMYGVGWTTNAGWDAEYDLQTATGDFAPGFYTNAINDLASGQVYYYSLVASNSAGLAISAPNAVTTVFEYVLQPVAEGRGSIVPSNATVVVAGDSQDFSFYPDKWYQISNVWVNGDAQGATNSYHWSDIQADGTITVSFVASCVSSNTPVPVPKPWLGAYGITNDMPARVDEDPDDDTAATWKEYVMDTDPTDEDSVLCFKSLSHTPTNTVLRWQASTARVYSVLWSGDLESGITNIVASNINSVVTGEITYSDNVHTNASGIYYKLNVDLP